MHGHVAREAAAGDRIMVIARFSLVNYTSEVARTGREQPMIYRTFGRTGWSVSEIGYGMWGLAGWTGSDEAESQATLELAVALGCNFFDTAWAYGDGRSEQILGGALEKPPGQDAALRHQDSAQEPAMALAARLEARRLSSRPTTSGNTPRRAWRTWALPRSTCSSSTSGKTPGPATTAGNEPWTT